MITQKTCEKIWHCHREIKVAEDLLVEVEKMSASQEANGEKKGLPDAFGQEQKLQLGIPSGRDSHRLFGLSWQLAYPVINAHIASKKRELVELNEIARLEISGAAKEVGQNSVVVKKFPECPKCGSHALNFAGPIINFECGTTCYDEEEGTYRFSENCTKKQFGVIP